MCNATIAKPKRGKKAKPVNKALSKNIRVRLLNYDWIVVNSSAGKDSQAMLDEVYRQAKALNILDRVVVVHADLGAVEWKGTRELAERQAQHYGVRFMVVSRKQGNLLQHVRDRAAKLLADGKDASPWPSSTARYCTSDHKRGQVATVLTQLSNEKHVKGKRVRILNCLGLRAAESSARSKKLPFKLDRNTTNGKKVVHTWLPIFNWSVAQVWDRIRESGCEHHYAYDLGMPRLSCCFCIFAPKSALMVAGKHNPELLGEYVKVEQEVKSRFRVELALVDVQEALARGEEPGEVTTWEM